MGLALGLDELRSAGDDPESVLLGIASATADLKPRRRTGRLPQCARPRGPLPGLTLRRDTAPRLLSRHRRQEGPSLSGLKYRARGESRRSAPRNSASPCPRPANSRPAPPPRPSSTRRSPFLEAKTEGWIAGIQLAALALRDGRDGKSFIEAFGGTTRSVADFPARRQMALGPSSLDLELLTALSVVDGFCAPSARPHRAEGRGGGPRRHREGMPFSSALWAIRGTACGPRAFREALLARMRASAPAASASAAPRRLGLARG
ncbi:MAG: hypothetical protein M0C28_24485 [Candidatus Moduliflexus flocculans]|nr:hypothetical protein [Candidatus Moduliflexus flocculans]